MTKVKNNLDDKDILLRWFPLEEKIRTIGHQMPNGSWYVYLPLFEGSRHFVPDSDVELLTKEKQIEHRASTEKRTRDRDYNEGSKLIRERGYEAVKDAVDVVYWCKCNGFD